MLSVVIFKEVAYTRRGPHRVRLFHRGRFSFDPRAYDSAVGKRPIPGEPIMKRYKQSSSGFTLVELLVVITIIGMLMALLLPAVNAAVELARAIACKNNMRNMGVAANAFESLKGRYPGHREYVPLSGSSGYNFGSPDGGTHGKGFS